MKIVRVRIHRVGQEHIMKKLRDSESEQPLLPTLFAPHYLRNPWKKYNLF